MKEIPAIIAAYRARPVEERAALATVIAVDGSSYRRPGARLLVTESGRWTGGISGGCLEGDALQKARKAILQDKASTVVYDTREPDEHQIGVGLGCNGRIEILIAPIQTENPGLNPVTIWEQIMESRTPCILVTLVDTPARKDELSAGTMWHWQEGMRWLELVQNETLATVLNAGVAEVKQTGKSTLCEAEGYRAFVEQWTPPIHLAIFGGHYDVHPLIRLAKDIGCKVSVTANLQKVSRDLVAEADELFPAGKYRPPVDDYTAVILMAHDYATDLDNFRWALTTPVPYIGLLGPRVRTQRMQDELVAEGLAVEHAASRIFGPAGLDIGAATPESIALSILAEVQARFAHRAGGHLRLRQSPIYTEVE